MKHNGYCVQYSTNWRNEHTDKYRCTNCYGQVQHNSNSMRKNLSPTMQEKVRNITLITPCATVTNCIVINATVIIIINRYDTK